MEPSSQESETKKAKPSFDPSIINGIQKFIDQEKNIMQGRLQMLQQQKKNQVERQKQDFSGFDGNQKDNLDEFADFIKDIIQAYVDDVACREVIQFPTSLNGTLRKIIHDMAEDYGICHKSRGKKKSKRICIFKSDEDFKNAVKAE